MQYKLNERLLAVLHADRPIAFTDVGDLTGPGNTITVRSPPAAPPTDASPVRFAPLTPPHFVRCAPPTQQSSSLVDSSPIRPTQRILRCSEPR